MSHPKAHQKPAVKPHASRSTSHRHTLTSEEMENCIAGCLACQAICLQTAFHCLEIGGARATADHIRLLLDCAEMCESSVHFMVSRSPFEGRICALCAEACRACEAACRRMSDEIDLRCAESCRRCAEMLPRAT